MKSKEALIRENNELVRRLELAQSWMRREVQGRYAEIQKEGVTLETRKHFANIFEEHDRELLVQKVRADFGEILQKSPEFTLERLIDAEIYWYMLQKFPHMDAFPVVASYQKILDSWLEDRLVSPWRLHGKRKLSPRYLPEDIFERDLSHILIKDYTLSLGRFFKLIILFRSGDERSPLASDIEFFWKKNVPKAYTVIISDDFFVDLSSLMKKEVFSSKRHEKKVSYTDAQMTRDLCIGTTSQMGILQRILPI